MNWVQSALNGCVPILRVLGFPDMCLYHTRHTRKWFPLSPGSTRAPDLSSPCFISKYGSLSCHLLTEHLLLK